MLTFELAPYYIEVFDNNNYDVSSSDNINAYDQFYVNTNGYRPSSIHGIHLFKGDQLLKSVAVAASGGGTGIHDHSCIVNSARLVICCGDTIFCLAVPELTLQWKTIADAATCFGIYPYQEDYIVHGEMAITRLNTDSDIIWQQGGADIFTTLEGKDDFMITDEYIIATDFQYRRYKFDFEGHIIA